MRNIRGEQTRRTLFSKTIRNYIYTPYIIPFGEPSKHTSGSATMIRTVSMVACSMVLLEGAASRQVIYKSSNLTKQREDQRRVLEMGCSLR